MKNFKVSFIVALFLLSALSFSAFAAPVKPVTSLTGTNGKHVKVIHMESIKVSDAQLASILSNAKKAIEEEKSNTIQPLNNSGDAGTTYDYITSEGSQIYFYEESAVSEPELIVYDADIQTVTKTSSSSDSTFTTLATQTDFIGDGVGGKQMITLTGSAGSYLSTQMTLPTSTQVSSDLTKYTPYNYGGFEYNSTNTDGIGSWASDMGLQLYNNLGQSLDQWGWKPILILKQKTSATAWSSYLTVFPDPSYAEGQYHNGYKPGTAPVMYFWYNYNGKVRMKVDGTTIYPDRYGTTLQDTHNITIMESNASWNISKISYWKLLSTVVSPDNTGKNRVVYSNVKLNGVAVPDANFSTPLLDQASITRTSNNVNIVVDSSIY